MTERVREKAFASVTWLVLFPANTATVASGRVRAVVAPCSLATSRVTIPVVMESFSKNKKLNPMRRQGCWLEDSLPHKFFVV